MMTEYQFWVRVLRIAAAVIGATVALWLLSGDRDPEARVLRALPPAVDYASSITIEHKDTFDRDGVFFFTLRFPDSGAIVISADDDLAVSQWLIHHAGARVQIVLRELPLTSGQASSRKDSDR